MSQKEEQGIPAPKSAGKSTKRHPPAHKELKSKPSRPEWRRLARRAGCKRIAHSTYSALEEKMDAFTKQILHDAMRYTDHSRRKTVTTMDISLALKRNKCPMYGYDA